MRMLKFLFTTSLIMSVVLLALVFSMPSYSVDYFKATRLPPIGTAKFSTTPQNEAIIQLYKDDQFICSGVVIDAQYALTAAHCLAQDNLTIHNSFGKNTGIKATIAGRGGRVDFGMIKGDFKNFQHLEAEFYTEGFMKPGPFIACGFPYGVKRLICGPYIPIKREGFYIAGAGSLYPGMSGGPVIDTSTKKVVGVNSAVGMDFTYVTSILGANGAFDLEP